MAKIGESDARWIVASRVDGKNVSNWHWAEKDLFPRVKEKLTIEFSKIIMQTNNVLIKFNEGEKIEGEYTAMNRKGKTIFVYDISAKLKWTGEINNTEEKITASGNVDVSDIMVDTDSFVVKINVDLDSSSKTPIKDLLKKKSN